ncbi:MAG: chromate resistance protein [Deltaproteobacteria bacterium]|nr:chromate resistance protein [Deltaproteobacteria bacterium]
MKWITREDAKVDRIACPWLIKRFIDEDAEFIFVPKDQVAPEADRQGAIPFDVAGIELGHVDGRCSFESILLKYGFTDNVALTRMAEIIHAADVSADPAGSAEGAGLKAIAHGFSILYGANDHKKMELEFPMYDALYAWCEDKVKKAF